jgi:hypothetical protein
VIPVIEGVSSPFNAQAKEVKKKRSTNEAKPA